jgi:tRNA threonylcarbamoyladenosine biosynthesis protein TsaB
VPRYLAIETSSPRLSLAGGNGTQILASYEGPLEWRHAEVLFQSLETIFKKLRWAPDTLEGVAVSIGPGSFTGIRIGLAAARALGQTLNIPVVGVSSLEAIAYAAPPRARWIAPALDALRGHVFTALYERAPPDRWRCVQKESLVSVEEWPRWAAFKRAFDEPLWVAGDGVALLQSQWNATPALRVKVLPPASGYPHAKTLLVLARKRWQRVNHYADAAPLYLRRAAAQERRR